MEELVRQIIEKEWNMFQQVKNIGGRASCQDDYETFSIMRSAQFYAWNGETLRSYLEDLDFAETKGENLVTEKYAYMMRWTDPAGYQQIKDRLPAVSPEKEALITEILDLQIRQSMELEEKYPRLMSRGRGHGTRGNGMTSIDVYTKGELLTYSEKTLHLYLNHIRDLASKGESLPEKIMEYTVNCYGYQSLSEAEEKMY